MFIETRKKILTGFYLLQIGISIIALGLLIVTYLQYSERIKNALIELDGIAENVEKQIEASIEIIDSVDSVIENVSKATNQHETTINSAILITTQISSTIKAWEDQLDVLPDISKDGNSLFNKYQERLKNKIEKVAFNPSLTAMSNSILKTKESLNKVNSMLSEDIILSLRSTKQNINNAESALKKLHEGTIPKVIEKLSSQKAQFHKSRDVFGVLLGLVPIIYIIFSILPIWMMVSGLCKLTELRSS